MTTALITGITGMVGSHLAEMFLSEHPDINVVGVKRWRSNTANIDAIKSQIKLVDCDLMDASGCFNLIKSTRPDLIFHLAAQTYVADSWKNPQSTFSQNVLMQLNLFEAIRFCQMDPVIQIAGSSEQYGKVEPDELPITEDNQFRPLSPYAVSKVTQDLLAYQYFQSYKLRVIRTRAFNHEGPRRGEVFVTSAFARQIAEIEAGLKEPVMYVGNLDASRDWSDVRDVVRAYWLAVNKCTPGEAYVISSGSSRTVRNMLDTLLSQTKEKIEVRTDPARLRPSDVLLLKGDSSKFRELTGWAPRIEFEQTMLDLLNWWRAQLSTHSNIKQPATST